MKPFLRHCTQLACMLVLVVAAFASCTPAEQEAAVVGRWQSTMKSDSDTIKAINIWELKKDFYARQGTFTRKMYIPGYRGEVGVSDGVSISVVFDMTMETSGKWDLVNDVLSIRQDINTPKLKTANLQFKYGDTTLMTLTDIAMMFNVSTEEVKSVIDAELRKDMIAYLNAQGATIQFSVVHLYKNELDFKYGNDDNVWKRIK